MRSLFGALLMATLVVAPTHAAEIDLLADPGAWSANVDREGTTVQLSSSDEAPLIADVVANGGAEDYPKLRIRFDEPQDWSGSLRILSRIRLVSDDASVTRKRIAFVLYDDEYRHEDLEGHPPVQQVIDHSVPVGEWLTFRDSLADLHRGAVLQLDLYIYEAPPGGEHSYRWEIAQLALESIEGTAIVFDGEPWGTGELAAQPGDEVGSVSSDDGLSITLGDEGGIARVAADGATVGAATEQATGLLMRDVADGGAPVQAGGTLTIEGDAIHQQAALTDLGLTLDATWRGVGDRIEVAGTIADTRGEDRAVTVYLALPLADVPWTWWDDVAHSQTEVNGFEEPANLESGVLYGLGGRHSRYPLGSVDLQNLAGLTLAVRMDEPVVHRITLNPALHTLYIALDFGLSPVETVHGTSLSQAPFRIVIYRHDPAWGMRSAVARYRSMFPEFFERRTDAAGAWYVWGDMQDTPGALEAGFQFHWGPAGVDAVKWDDEHGITSLLYIEPEMYQQTHGDLDHAPTLDEALGRLERLAAGDEAEIEAFMKLGYSRSYVPAAWVRQHSPSEAVQAVARAAETSLQLDSAGRPWTGVGQYSWMSESKWGVIFPCNLDPDIPGGKGYFCRNIFIEPGLQGFEEQGARIDGIALDSFGGYGQTSRVDYRREHFQYADIPLSFAANDRRPVIVSAFATIEWLRELAADMHGRGMVLMANCSWGRTPAWLTFAAPHLDVFGAESPTFADPDLIRFLAGPKACTSLPYNPRPVWETERHLLHGIWPGHGTEIAEMTRLAPTLRLLAEAQWRPMTGVRAEPASVQVERFGEGDVYYLTAFNPAQESVSAVLTWDAAVLGARPFAVQALIGPDAKIEGNTLRIELGPQQTAVLAVPIR